MGLQKFSAGLHSLLSENSIFEPNCMPDNKVPAGGIHVFSTLSTLQSILHYVWHIESLLTVPMSNQTQNSRTGAYDIVMNFAFISKFLKRLRCVVTHRMIPQVWDKQ